MMENSSSLLLLRLLLLLAVFLNQFVSSYPNVTLKSGDLAVTIYLPSSLAQNGSNGAYYEGSRFEHGSMIGSITRKNKNNNQNHVLYGTDTWRVPHDPAWPESGVGLASEFGVGDNGDFCPYRCGWYGVNNVTNGVLGFNEARHGEAFLKIGVGALIKGSCPACDSISGYKFNSPYKFESLPRWTMSQPSVGTIAMQHEAHVKNYGYRIQKNIRLDGNTLYVTTTLVNLGIEPFSTVWYSHHFFSCDGRHIGAGYEVDMDLRASSYPIGSAIRGDGGMAGLYEEPGVLQMWSKELSNYAHVKRSDTNVKVRIHRAVEPGVRIKAEFVKDEMTAGSFGLKACGTWIGEEIPEVKQHDDKLSMYGFNLYIEEGILSPEPQLLISLKPNQSKSWTQRLVIQDDDQLPLPPLTELMQTSQKRASILLSSSAGGSSKNYRTIIHAAIIPAAMVALAMLAVLSTRQQQQQRYVSLPDAELTV